MESSHPAMDAAHPMLLFDAPAAELGVPDDALMDLFSSPTTEPVPAGSLPALPRADAAMSHVTAPPPVHDPLATLSNLIGAPLVAPPLRAPPKPEPAPAPAPSSDDDSAPSARRGFARLGGKNRSLPDMRAVAKRNAPNASLTDEDLIAISAMHESDAALSESRHIYTSLVAFKAVLARYGYRIKSLYLDAAPREAAAESETLPFAFVLNKNPAPASDARADRQDAPAGERSEYSGSMEEPPAHAPAPAPASAPAPAPAPALAPAESGGGSAGSRRRSVTMSHTDDSNPRAGGADAVNKGGGETGPSPRKRARTSLRSSRDGGDAAGAQRHACGVCTKKMSDQGTLVRHFRHAHQEMKPFECPKCGGFYSSEGTLWHHISNVHSDTQRIHKCEYCDASYDSSGAKTRHVHGTHHVKRPLYSCPFPECPRTFVFPAHLEHHASHDHAGFRPFRCTECSKAFPSANGLVRHAREVHRREKAYTCPVCNAGLTKRCHLKRHLLNVHHLPVSSVDEEMKKHPNPGDISVMPSASTG